MKDLPDESMRAQIYAGCADRRRWLTEVSGKEFAIRQLRLLADKLEKQGQTLQ